MDFETEPKPDLWCSIRWQLQTWLVVFQVASAVATTAACVKFLVSK